MIMASRATRRLRASLHGTPLSTAARGSQLLTTSSIARAQAHPGEKDEIVVESQEYSKSGFDSWAAETENTAFSKRKDLAQPQTELEDVKQESTNIGQQNSPLDVSPANKEISSPSNSQGGDASQTKVAGQGSLRRATPKGTSSPRYDARGGQTGSTGTGSYPTQNQETPGPKFPSASKRQGKKQWPEHTERRKYVGGGR